MNSATKPLSDYQRGVLHELGIVCWKKQTSADDAVSSLNAVKHPVSSSQALTNTTNKEAALSRLQHLKTEQPKISYAGKVLCAFSPTNDCSSFQQDIMYALELSDYPIMTLTQAQVAQAKDWVFMWQYGDELGLTAKKLTTPELNHLKDPVLKKRLWQLIQNYSA